MNNFENVYTRIKSELSFTPKGRGIVAIYKMVLEHFDGDATVAEEFLLSKYGGFEQEEVTRARGKVKHNKARYIIQKEAFN